MKYFLSAILVMALVAGIGFAAESHDNAKEKGVSDEITLSQAVKVGNQLVAAGRYRITCDRENIKFEKIGNGKNSTYTFPCQGKELQAKAKTTELHITTTNGERVATALLLRGSTIEHTF